MTWRFVTPMRSTTRFAQTVQRTIQPHATFHTHGSRPFPRSHCSSFRHIQRSRSFRLAGFPRRKTVHHNNPLQKNGGIVAYFHATDSTPIDRLRTVIYGKSCIITACKQQLRHASTTPQKLYTKTLPACFDSYINRPTHQSGERQGTTVLPCNSGSEQLTALTEVHTIARWSRGAPKALRS